MLKKAKLYFLLAIMVASTAVGALGVAQTVSAQELSPSVYIPPDMESDLIAKQWREAMIGCINGSQEITHLDLASGKWFPVETDKNVGYLVDPSDGRYPCNEDVFVDEFIDLFGWDSPFIAACALGFTPRFDTEASPEQCIESDLTEGDDAKYYYSKGDKGKFANDAINKKYGSRFNYGSGAPGPSQKYVLYLLTFMKACQPYGPVESIPAGEATSYSREVKLVNAEGETSPVYFRIGNPGEKNISYDRSDGTNAGLSMDCDELADAITAGAPGYAEWVSGLNLTDSAKAEGTVTLSSLNEGGSGGGAGSNPSSCSVGDGIGWFICPISNSIAKGVDVVFDLVKRFLRVEPLSFDTSNSLYVSWSIFRNYANVIFAIIFLVIIYAQITGGLLSAYTIKTMVPRLVVGAILVNASYLICALAVDISNMLGSYLQDLFMDIRSRAGGETADNIPTWETATFYVLSGGTVLAGGVLAVTTLPLMITGATSLLWFIVPLLTGAIFSVFVALLVLAARQALITILIVLSPLAFAAYILPNTQKWFDRWRDLFMTLLIMFPIMSVLFGGSQLAASIIMNSATNIATVFLALGVQVIPLAITPFIIKLSGSLLGRFAGMVNNPNKGPIDRINKWAGSKKERADERSFGTDTPSTWQRLAQRADRRRRRTEERSTVDRKAADTRYGEYASTDPELLELRRRAKELEVRDERATDRSSRSVADAMAGSAASQNLLALAENEKLERKRAEDNLAEVVAPLVDSTIRVGAAEAEASRQATEDAIEAGVRRGMSRGVVARLEDAQRNKRIAENEVARDIAPLVSQASRTAEMVSELQKQEAEDTATSRATSGAALAAASGAAKIAKANKQAAENENEAAAIRAGGARLAAASGAEKTTELDKQTAENRLATDAASHVSRDARVAAYESDLRKQDIENRKEAAAIRAADTDAKVGAAASAELLNAANSEARQALEESIAGHAPAGVSGSTTAQAQAARRATNVTTGATESAKRVSDQSHAEEVLRDSRLARQVGGIDPHGESRAAARAASTISSAFDEAVSNEKKTMSTMKPAQLNATMQDTRLSKERRAAAAAMLVQNGSAQDVMNTINYLGEQKRRGGVDIGDIQQQVISDLGDRAPAALGAGAKAALRNGDFDGTMDELMRNRITDGKMSVDAMSRMPKEELDHMISIINGSVTLRATAEFSKLKNELRDFRTNPQYSGRQPAAEVTDRMDVIRSL